MPMMGSSRAKKWHPTIGLTQQQASNLSWGNISYFEVSSIKKNVKGKSKVVSVSKGCTMEA
jgi:hypothetical protein